VLVVGPVAEREGARPEAAAQRHDALLVDQFLHVLHVEHVGALGRVLGRGVALDAVVVGPGARHGLQQLLLGDLCAELAPALLRREPRLDHRRRHVVARLLVVLHVRPVAEREARRLVAPADGHHAASADLAGNILDVEDVHAPRRLLRGRVGLDAGVVGSPRLPPSRRAVLLRQVLQQQRPSVVACLLVVLVVGPVAEREGARPEAAAQRHDALLVDQFLHVLHVEHVGALGRVLGRGVALDAVVVGPGARHGLQQLLLGDLCAELAPALLRREPRLDHRRRHVVARLLVVLHVRPVAEREARRLVAPADGHHAASADLTGHVFDV